MVRPVHPATVVAAVAKSSLLLLAALVVLAFAATRAEATPTPKWSLDLYQPTELLPGESSGKAAIYVRLVNDGGAPADGSPITITAELPTGVTVSQSSFGAFTVGGEWMSSCTGIQAVTCTISGRVLGANPERFEPGVVNSTFIPVDVAADVTPGGLPATLSVSGGGAAPVTASIPIEIGPRASEFGILDFDGAAVADDGSGATQAGGHPFSASTTVDFAGRVGPIEVVPAADVRNVTVDLPVGFVGNPQALPTCTEGQLLALDCPEESQVGVATYLTAGPVEVVSALYNMKAPDGMPAQFAFLVTGNVVHLDARVRTGSDNGISVDTRNIPQPQPVLSTTVTLWGTPADPVHDPMRQRRGGSNFGASSSAPRVPFVTLPADCSAGPLPTDIRATPWQSPIIEVTGRFMSHLPDGSLTGATGCESVPFRPGLSVEPSSRVADGPTGLDVAMSFPQEGLLDPGGIATSPLRTAKVTLPEGLTINPAAADGLVACADADLRPRSAESVSCPPASKIGTATATSPLVAEPLTGQVFVRPQVSDDPESGELFRLVLVLDSEERGLLFKLLGSVKANARTGRLEATFADNPQLPVSKLSVKLHDGPRAPLANPAECGAASIVTSLSSWSGRQLDLADTHVVDCRGPAGFAPAFSAGATNPVAGGFAAFLVSLDRRQGEQYLSGLDLRLPAGLTARLKGVPVCPESQAAAGTCGAGSRIGSATVGAGSGSQFYLRDQPVYLGGPYKGAPYSLAVVNRVVAGPFDLGTVVVRQALHVDPTDAHITVKSDPFPTIVKGVPLRLRTVDVDIDRPQFALNPTSCAPKSIAAQVTAQNGDRADTRAAFRVGDCGELAFAPKLTLALTGKKQTKTGKHPGLKATVKQAGIGEAGISRAKVTLPKSLALDPNNAQALCEFADGTKPDLENHCPKGSIVGRAKAVTPLLDKPLAGNVYFVKNVERNPRTGALIRKLPMLVAALRGEVSINLVGKTSSTSRSSQLVTTFPAVPDAPVSKFTMSIAGGRSGILVVTRTRKAKLNLCSAKQVARVQTKGHNRKSANFAASVKRPCAKKAGKRKK